MRKNRFLAALGVTVGLLAGGVTALVLGTPAVSGAQTTTSPPTTAAPTQGGSSDNQSPATPTPGGGRPHNCPNMGGNGGTNGGTRAPNASGNSTAPSDGAPAAQLGFRRFSGGGRV